MNNAKFPFQAILISIIIVSCTKENLPSDNPTQGNDNNDIINIINKGEILSPLKETPDSIYSISLIKVFDSAPSGSVQGASCYGDYLFQFSHANTPVFIYSMQKQKLVSTVELLRIENDHCNNVSFSNIYYKNGDEFPLLYVSGSSTSTYNRIQVYRIVRDNTSFTITAIQEITLPEASSYNNLYWTDAILDNENKLLYVTSNANNGPGIISIFKIPSISSQRVKLKDSDIIQQILIPPFTHHQGACIKNNKLYIFDGVPGWGDTNYLRIIDLVTKKDAYYINLTKKGFKLEVEGAFFWQDDLYCITNGRGVFRIVH